jgi:hypothetical protein
MIALAGFLGLIALGVALLAWRTADIQGLAGFEQAARQILLQCSR